MTSRAILVNFRNYCGFGNEFFEPLLDFFLATMKKYQDEYDHIYLLDSNWEIDPEKIKELKATIIKVNPSLGYVDAYKSVLPQVKEELVLLLDNDTVIYKAGIIQDVFQELQPVDLQEEPPFGGPDFDVVSIFDTIGEFKTDKMGGKNKLCPYFFATRTELLKSYRDIDWNSHMPHSETLGLLTEAMLNDRLKIYEWEEDKSNILFDGTQEFDGAIIMNHQGKGYGKNLGYYHIRAGSTPAVLLAWKNSPNHQPQYQEYIKNQPKSEILRQLAWYHYICQWTPPSYERDEHNFLPIDGIINDLNIADGDWHQYLIKFKEYHNLP